MRMPDPSRSRPSPWTVRPSGLIWVLIRTTAETRSSIEAVSAAAADVLTREMTIAPSTARGAMPEELPREALAMNPPSAIVISLVSTSAAAAEKASIDDLVSAVVRINTHINPEGRTVQGLGREREGSGILIDSDGLVLTIGYLMVEAYAAEVGANNGRTMPANVVGYDQESGFGLLRAIAPLKLKPMPLGKSAEIKEGDPVLIASFGGRGMVAGAYVVAKREFAGSWEYLLDEALFTAPPHPAWSGAALISREGKLMGVGSLIVGGSDKV